MNVVALFSSWQWMAYQPTFPLMLTLHLHQPVILVSCTLPALRPFAGTALTFTAVAAADTYATFIGFALLSTLLLSKMTAHYSPRQLLLGIMLLRAASGALHTFAIFSISGELTGSLERSMKAAPVAVARC